MIFYTQNKTTMEEVQEEYRVSVYIELIATYDWNLEMVDERYVEAVKKELGIIEA